MKSTLSIVASALVILAATGCSPAEPPAPVTPQPPVEIAESGGVDTAGTPAEEPELVLTSPAFQPGGSIPSLYTCDESDTIPPLDFANVPQNAKSLAVVMDDPDVPPPGSGNVWDHWVVWNIPPTTRRIAEGTNPSGVTGLNSWERNDYAGPCPPDREHRYYFHLYALDTTIDLPDTAGKKELEAAMEGHIVGQAELMGRYVRKN